MLCLWAATAVYASERVALVVGNSAYRTAPLQNPRNDAEAMATLLKDAGFAVDKQLDTDLQSLQSAVDRFGQAIKDPKVKFGLFYYAGHGLQQDWRNYLVPVSANIRTSAEVPKQTVDVSSLLRYMEQAQGRSFLVVLDACRDDPFAGTYRPPAKGLSQFDAPVGSLLAYATAPGSVAQDGDGKNGLYTSNLLREFAVRGTRIEDAFKRVRLNVRLASKGAQVPWESTSLEEDVYLFPTPRKNLTEAERDLLLEQEMASWLHVKSSTDPQALAGFIREYPSGSASELAQSRMSRLLAASALQEAQRLKTVAHSAGQVAAELAEREAAARRRTEEAEQRRVAAERAEQERVRLAQAEAVRQEASRAQAQRAAAEQAALARQAAEAARLAEAEAQRVAAAQRAAAAMTAAQQAQTSAAQRATLEAAQVARREAERLAQDEAQAAARAQALAQAAQAEVQRMQIAKARQEADERALVLQAEQARLEQARLAEQQQRELARLAAEKQTAQTLLVAANTVLPPVTLAPTPFYKGYAEHQRQYSQGDEYQIRVVDQSTKTAKPLVMKVTQVDLDAERVVYNDGEFVSDLMGNTTTNQRGVFGTPRQFYPADLFVGKKWETRFKQSPPQWRGVHLPVQAEGCGQRNHHGARRNLRGLQDRGAWFQHGAQRLPGAQYLGVARRQRRYCTRNKSTAAHWLG